MKGSMGLVIAVFLGVLGGILNLFYLNQSESNLPSVAFIGIKKGAEIKVGDKFNPSKHFAPVNIPAEQAENLKSYAVPYSELEAVIDLPAVRAIEGDELLLHSDIASAPLPKLDLKAGERAVFVPVDSGVFIESLIVPGVTPVQFYLPGDNGKLETLGPFTVISVGNRMGTPDTAQKIARRNQNIITILGTPKNREQINKLQLVLLRSNKRPLDVDVLPTPKVEAAP